MTSGREILSLFLVVLFLAALAGCGKKAAEEEPTEELVIEALVGIGPVKFGASQTEVIEYFGEPDRTSEGKVTKLVYVPSRGLNFVFDAELGLQEIGCWSEGMLPSGVTTFSGRTKKGIRIGATRDEIVAAYGQPDRTSTDSKGVIESLHYDKLSARFSIKDGKLMSMVMEAPK